jgi:hypothetical protein
MIGGVSRRVDGTNYYIRTLDCIASCENAIHAQLEIVIRPWRKHCAHRSAAQLFEPVGPGSVIQMGVGTQDPSNPDQ